MTDQHLTEVALLYLTKLRDMGVQPVKHDLITPHSTATVKLEHTAWMCQKIVDYVGGDFREKASRWLGFVQCMLWDQGIYSVDELRQHNKVSP
jgi:hypothetical protein